MPFLKINPSSKDISIPGNKRSEKIGLVKRVSF
jgi:hypothetical protein